MRRNQRESGLERINLEEESVKSKSNISKFDERENGICQRVDKRKKSDKIQNKWLNENRFNQERDNAQNKF